MSTSAINMCQPISRRKDRLMSQLLLITQRLYTTNAIVYMQNGIKADQKETVTTRCLRQGGSLLPEILINIYTSLKAR